MASHKFTPENIPPEQLLTQFSWNDPMVSGYVKNFFVYLTRDALRNMDRLGIKNRSGMLRRAIYWKTWQAAGGDVQMFTLMYQRYAKFVELALGKGHELVKIAEIGGPGWRPIPRPDGKPRKAKPFITSELRMQVRKFENMLLSQFAFRGTAYILWGLQDKDPDAQRELRRLQKQYIRFERRQ